jgi:hypothetical protein
MVGFVRSDLSLMCRAILPSVHRHLQLSLAQDWRDSAGWLRKYVLDLFLHPADFSAHIRAQEQFVFDIPEALKSEDAASMLCGGLTVFSPLVRAGVKKGSKVGVVGIGGL